MALADQVVLEAHTREACLARIQRPLLRPCRQATQSRCVSRTYAPAVCSATRQDVVTACLQDMETFQRMNALDAEALRRIFRKFQEVDRVSLHKVDCQCAAIYAACHRNAPVWWM